MLAAEKKYGRFIAIGYQWSFSEAIQTLKADVFSGILGKPEHFKTAISWPRNRAYYQRGSGWGGCIQKSGRLILDSIASNACAHYLHNMLFLLGGTMQTSAMPTEFRAECYRANNIENFDTCCIKLWTASGVQMYFAATHAAQKARNPVFEYAFEKARVVYSRDEGSQIIAQFHDGSEKVYGDPFANDFRKLWDCVDAVKKGTIISTVFAIIVAGGCYFLGGFGRLYGDQVIGEEGGVAFGTNPATVEKITSSVKKVCTKPLIVKLSPNVTDITQTAHAAEVGGADCLSLINTLLGMRIDIKTKRPVLHNNVGALSGPAVKPVAVRMVWQVRKVTDLPIIGMGGIASWEDAVEFLMAGANAVSIGCAAFSNPSVPLEVIDGIEKYMEANNISDISEITGSVIPY